MRQSWDRPLSTLGTTPREFLSRNVALFTDSQIASILRKAGFSVTTDAVQKRRCALGIRKVARGGDQSYVKVDESPYVRYDKPPTVEGDVAVFGDLELPFHEHNFLNHVLELCQKWGIAKVIFNGDLLHDDNLSSFDPNWQDAANPDGLPDGVISVLAALADDLPDKYGYRLKEVIEQIGHRTLPNPTSISEEWGVARKALRAMQQIFTKGAVWGLGNHEGRLIRNIQSPLLPEDFKRILVGEDTWLKVAPYYWGLIESGGVQWRYTHPKNTSVIPASVAMKLADKFDMNVIQAHNHLWGMAQSASGKYIGVEAGCMVDGARLPYYSQRDTTRPAWQNGCVIIRDGHCWLLHPTWTDWNLLSRL